MLSARNIQNGRIVFDEFRLISDDDFLREDSRTEVRPGDVLLTIVGTIGRCAVVPTDCTPFALQRSVAVVRPDGAIPSFLMYQLQAPDVQRWLSQRAAGTAQKGIYLRVLAELPLRVPPLDEQRRIVAAIEEHLSRLDAAVGGLKRVQAMIPRYRAAVLKAAVDGTLLASVSRTGQGELGRPTTNGGSRNGLPQLPEGWNWSTLGEVGALQGGIQKQPSRRPVKNKYPFLRVANVSRGSLDLSDVHEIEVFDGELDRLRLVKGDLLIVEGNGSASQIGRLAVWQGAIKNCVHQNHLIRHRPRVGVLPEYVATYWNSPEGSRRVSEVASSTSGLFTLSVGKISRLPIPLPPQAEQVRIVAEVERRLSLLSAMESEVKAGLVRADLLRQSILKRAFEGKLVPQDPNDEPASVLLERIRAARAAAVPHQGRKGAPRTRKTRAQHGSKAE